MWGQQLKKCTSANLSNDGVETGRGGCAVAVEEVATTKSLSESSIASATSATVVGGEADDDEMEVRCRLLLTDKEDVDGELFLFITAPDFLADDDADRAAADVDDRCAFFFDDEP